MHAQTTFGASQATLAAGGMARPSGAVQRPTLGAAWALWRAWRRWAPSNWADRARPRGGQPVADVADVALTRKERQGRMASHGRERRANASRLRQIPHSTVKYYPFPSAIQRICKFTTRGSKKFLTGAQEVRSSVFDGSTSHREQSYGT